MILALQRPGESQSISRSQDEEELLEEEEDSLLDDEELELVSATHLPQWPEHVLEPQVALFV